MFGALFGNSPVNYICLPAAHDMKTLFLPLQKKKEKI